MKKWGYVFVIVIFFYILKQGQALAITDSSEFIQEITLSEKVILIEDNIEYVPIWRIAEAMGLEVFTEPKTKTISLRKGEKWLNFSGQQEKIITSEGRSAATHFIFKNDNIYVPSKFISNYFGYQIVFEGEEHSIEKVENEIIKSTEKPVINDFPTPTLESDKNKTEVVKEEKPKGTPVYLTFDDGPNQAIVPILNTLRDKGAKATFFMLEPHIKQYANEVKRLVEEGHYPALHSVTHDKNKLYKGDPLNVAREMEQTRKTLLDVTGVDSTLTRVPYGSKPFMMDALRNGLVENGFKMWDWTIDTVDWKYQSNPNVIVQKVKEGIEAQKGSNKPIIILMHVNKGTASVLPEIIEYLYEQGFYCEAYNPENHFSMNFWKDERL